MKKITFVLLFLLLTLNIFSNRFWNNEKNYKQILTVESIISYSPSIVNFVYGHYDLYDIIKSNELLRDNNDLGFYYSDSIQWSHMFNLYPVFQIGYVINYRWTWGLKTFVFSNYYRMLGFKFDVYNLTLKFSLFDIGFSWYKYNWYTQEPHNNQFCLLINPITVGIQYRVKLNEYVDIFLDLGYNLQIIIDNKIIFPNKDIDASMFLEHSFNQGIGFRFYTKNFK